MPSDKEYRSNLESFLASVSILKAMQNLGILTETDVKKTKEKLAKIYGINLNSLFF